MTYEPAILVVDDEQTAADTVREYLVDEGFHAYATYSGPQALELMAGQPVNVAVIDLRMPQMDGMTLLQEIQQRHPDTYVVMVTAYATISTAVEAMKNGAHDYITKPFKLDELSLVIQRAVEQERLREENRSLKQQLDQRYGLENVIGVSPRMKEIYRTIHKLAPTDATVLICGESGTGKELIARAIHHNSDRKNGHFLTIDCGALPRDLLESELFGHVRGSFTGAVATKYGLFEAAQGGTVFLDEISNAPEEIQVKLLRVLQEREIRRIGDTQPIQVDVRVIAATNRCLEERIQNGQFREDLYYRLNVVPIELPLLRERTEDIPLLACHFLQQHAKSHNRPAKAISEAAMKHLIAYDWPGNVRELEHAIERSVILCEGATIEPDDLPPRQRNTEPADDDEALTILVQRYEKTLIQTALTRHRGNQYRAAKELGVSRQSLQYKLKKYGLLTTSPT